MKFGFVIAQKHTSEPRDGWIDRIRQEETLGYINICFILDMKKIKIKNYRH